MELPAIVISFATTAASAADSSITFASDLPAGIFQSPVAVTPAGSPSTLKTISPSKPPERTACTATSDLPASGSATVIRLQTSYGERIKLVAPDAAAPLPAHHPEHVFDQANVMYLTFIIRDIQAVTARVLAQGGRAMSGPEPIESRPGLFVVFLRDPEGNVVELVEPVA